MTEACFPGPLCSVGAEVLGPAHVHVRVLLLYSQLLLLPHSNSSNTSRGRPGARHPPLRGDSATPGRLPAGLRRRLDHDTQARCSRPARAFCPGLLPSRSLPARLQRLAPAARQKKKSGSTPWVVGACGTRGGHRMSELRKARRGERGPRPHRRLAHHHCPRVPPRLHRGGRWGFDRASWHLAGFGVKVSSSAPAG